MKFKLILPWEWNFQERLNTYVIDICIFAFVSSGYQRRYHSKEHFYIVQELHYDFYRRIFHILCNPCCAICAMMIVLLQFSMVLQVLALQLLLTSENSSKLQRQGETVDHTNGRVGILPAFHFPNCHW